MVFNQNADTVFQATLSYLQLSVLSDFLYSDLIVGIRSTLLAYSDELREKSKQIFENRPSDWWQAMLDVEVQKALTWPFRAIWSTNLYMSKVGFIYFQLFSMIKL
jgi:hypothetical protein